jgi:carbon monoxide dehydrogenase subunit G
MELTNTFRVSVPVEQAWAVLTDVERIAPCLPGAQLQEVEGDEYRGVVKVKVGPITAQYKGRASFIERDPVGWKAVLKAEGRDTRGQGNASALVTATLVAEGSATTVEVVTDLTITGKVAQFGRGVLADVSAKLIDQFVESLERDVLSGSSDAGPGQQPQQPAEQPAEQPAGQPAGQPGGSPNSSGAPTVRRIDAPEAAPVNLLDTAGVPVAKRLAPLAALTLFVWVLFRRRRRRRAAS